MAQLTVPRARRMLLVMKPESSYGVDVLAGSYLNTDVIPAMDIQPSMSIEEIENLAASGDLGRIPSGIGRVTASVSFRQLLRGAGQAYSASVKPNADLPLRGCGLAATLDATGGAEMWTYQPTATHEAMTIYLVIEIPGGNAVAIKLVGCVGTVDVTMRAAAVADARYTYYGALDGVADLSYVAGAIAATPVPPSLKSAAFQIGSGNYAPRIASLTFRLNNRVTAVPSVNATSGLAGWYIEDRKPTLQLDPEADRVANFAWYQAITAGTLQDCSFQAGTAQYNRLLFNFGAGGGSQMQVLDHGLITRDGLVAFQPLLLATIASGNDDFRLRFS